MQRSSKCFSETLSEIDNENGKVDEDTHGNINSSKSSKLIQGVPRKVEIKFEISRKLYCIILIALTAWK